MTISNSAQALATFVLKVLLKLIKNKIRPFVANITIDWE